MKPIQMGIIGYGGMGRYHATRILTNEPNVVIKGGFDPVEKRQLQLEKDGFHAYTSLNDLLADEELEAILIATPNDLHKELTIKSVRAGKHVVCEKPVALSVAEFDEMVLAAEEEGKTLLVHQNRRWDEDFLIAKTLYQDKDMGNVFQIETRVHGANGIPGDWRHEKDKGGGMLLDWGVHLLDQLLFLVDSPVQSVYGSLSFTLGNDVDDGFFSELFFENGLKAIVEVGTTNSIKLPRWYIKGSEGTACIQDWDLSGELILRNEKNIGEPKPIQAGQGLTKTMAPPSEKATKTSRLPEGSKCKETFYGNFYEIIRNKKEAVVKNEEVREVLQLIEDIFSSSSSQKVIIKERK